MAPKPVDVTNELARLRRLEAVHSKNVRTLTAISALVQTMHNSKEPIEKIAPEGFYAILDLLGGRTPEKLELKLIDKGEFMRELRE